MTLQEFNAAYSETAKYRSLTVPHCYLNDGTPGCGVDIASQGDSVVPWAIGFDLPSAEFHHYCGGAKAKGFIQLRGHAQSLPFDGGSLDFVYSSHLLEDYLEWTSVLKEWVRVLKAGGKLIVLVPDKRLWSEAIKRGQVPNMAHKHEAEVGELTSYASILGVTVLEDRLTALIPEDYSILFVAIKM